MVLQRKHKKHQKGKLGKHVNTETILKGEIRMSDFQKFKEEMLNNPEIKEEYEALEPEFNIIQAMIDTRKSQNLTQKDLSKRTGIT